MLQGHKLRPANRHLSISQLSVKTSPVWVCGDRRLEEAGILHNGKACLSVSACGFSVMKDLSLAWSDRSSGVQWDSVECKNLQERLDQLGVDLDTCAAILQKFRHVTCFPHGKKLYNLIGQAAGNISEYMDSLLVQMSVDVGNLQQAHILATKVPHLNLVVWNCLIGAYVGQDRCKTAFQVFVSMQKKGVFPDKITYINILAACNDPSYLVRGKILHHMIMCSEIEVDVVLETGLLTMYNKCCGFEDMVLLFDFMDFRNVVSWTVIIGAYASNQQCSKAFYLHNQMKQEGVLPNRITIMNLLNACLCPKRLMNGKQLHSCIIGDIDFNMHAIATLLHMYGKCGNIEDSQALFHALRDRDDVVWNAFLGAVIRHGMHTTAIQLFRSMLMEGTIPSVVTYATILRACAYCNGSTAKSMHTYILSNGFQDNVVIATALITLYGRHSFLDTAMLLFYSMKERNIVSWNSVITLHAERADLVGSLCFWKIMQYQGVFSNSVTYTSLLEALAGKEGLLIGKRLHCQILETEYKADLVVETALTNMYFRCNVFKDGSKVFMEMPKRNLIAWNTMISACGRYGYAFEGFRCFEQMQKEGFVPDQCTYSNILSICATQLIVLTLGRVVHHDIILSESASNPVVVASLLDMYGKCGSIEDAYRVFNRMSKDSVVVWNAMISTYAHHVCVEQAIGIVNAMMQQGVAPNNVTFLSLLHAFSHAGTLAGASFDSLLLNYCGIKAKAEQCRSIVDLHARAGRVEEAILAIWKMPLDPSSIAWMTLLGSCRHALDATQAMHIADHIFEYDSGNSAAIKLLASING